MSKRIWPKSEEHPPLAALTLHLEGELEGREAAAVSRHVNDCWTCRRELERLEKGVYAFVDYRRDVLLPSVPPPPPERSSFVQRLREEATRERRPSLLQLARDLASDVPSYVSRTGWALGSVAAIVLAALTVYWFSSTPKLSASEFLRRSRAARISSDTRRSAILYQKVQIRRGSSLFQQATYRGPAARSLREEQYESPDPETVRALRLAGINWQDPLNADDFAVWHDAHPEGRDRVVRSADRVTLRSDEPRSSEVAAASLTVMAEDWHPVARYVEFRDQPPVEITELSYEFRYPPPVSGSPEPPPAPVSNALPAPKPNAEAKSGLKEAELDEDEMRLREAFHDIGADVREAPEVRKTERGVEFRVWAESGERKQEILQAAAAIPNVMPVNELATSVAPDVPTPAAPMFSTQPPLAKALWDYMGGLDLANRFIANLSASFDRILTSAAAMGRLSERYSANHWEELTPDLQARVNRLAADYLAAIRSESGIYVGRMSPVLDEMFRRNQLALDAEATESSVGCQAWQAFPPEVLADIKQLHTSFRRLFVEEQVETPILLRSDDLLRDSALARAHLSAHVRDVCQPLPVPSVEQR